ncbi:MAG: hypothetical protein LH654_13460, partial [Thermoleophilia bacterium]|nr:hypothetical protein [Thermoleophilia bacterium]
VSDQLGLEAVDEALGERVVIRVTNAADRRLDAVVVEGLAVVVRDVLLRLNRSSLHRFVDLIVNTR